MQLAVFHKTIRSSGRGPSRRRLAGRQAGLRTVTNLSRSGREPKQHNMQQKCQRLQAAHAQLAAIRKARPEHALTRHLTGRLQHSIVESCLCVLSRRRMRSWRRFERQNPRTGMRGTSQAGCSRKPAISTPQLPPSAAAPAPAVRLAQAAPLFLRLEGCLVCRSPCTETLTPCVLHNLAFGKGMVASFDIKGGIE